MSERMFPIMGYHDIPWRAIAPADKQARINHSQTLETLAARGGLTPCEAIAVMQFRPWTKKEEGLARELLDRLVVIELDRQAKLAPAPAIRVEVGCMTESSGKKTWCVTLYRPGDSITDGFQVYASASEGRARFTADEYRHVLGQGPKPNSLSYDTTLSEYEETKEELAEVLDWAKVLGFYKGWDAGCAATKAQISDRVLTINHAVAPEQAVVLADVKTWRKPA